VTAEERDVGVGVRAGARKPGLPPTRARQCDQRAGPAERAWVGWEGDETREASPEAAAVVVASAAEDETQAATGMWDGTWEGAYGRRRIVMVLVQNASELTGTVAVHGTSPFSAEPQAIRDGRTSDRAATFAVDGVAGRIDATATIKGKDASGTFMFRGAPYRFAVVRQ
jgi:hypothetical protein